MKKVISVFAMVVLMTATAFAQQHQQGQRQGRQGSDWRERVRAEKVAFLTREIDLTESEAQVFWPIYNELQQKQHEGFQAVKEAYDAMEKGVKEGKTGKEMEKLVKAYIDAKDANEGIETQYLNKLMKALPAEKVARYYIAEEKFRHQQIGRLGSGNFPNFKMSEEQKKQWKERGEQLREQGEQFREQLEEQFQGRKGQKKEKSSDTPTTSESI